MLSQKKLFLASQSVRPFLLRWTYFRILSKQLLWLGKVASGPSSRNCCHYRNAIQSSRGISAWICSVIIAELWFALSVSTIPLSHEYLLDQCVHLFTLYRWIREVTFWLLWAVANNLVSQWCCHWLWYWQIPEALLWRAVDWGAPESFCSRGRLGWWTRPHS